MAVTITRKFLPVATGTNQQTPNCSSCPFDCPFDCFDFPDFNFPPPSPPPRDHQKQLQPVTIVLIALFVGFFFAFSFYILLVKCRAWGSGSRNVAADSQSDGGEGEFVNENQIEHPIWFITTVGLQQSVINSITVCKYNKSDGLIEGTECSVCLSEFQEDEMLRLLPKCSHAFHIGCVDTWLRTHTTCPLCRAHILTDFASSNSLRPTNLGAVNQNEANLGVIEETQIENLEINGEVLGENQSVDDENRGDVDEQREIGVQIGEMVPKEVIFEPDEGTETIRNRA